MPRFEIEEERQAAPAPSRRQVMLATESTRTVVEEEQFTSDDTPKGRANKVTHETAGRVTLWQPIRGRWIPKEVAATNIRENFDMGWRTECGACGTTHGIEEDLRKGSDLNACDMLPPIPVAYCPRCNGKFFDPGDDGTIKRDDDPNAVNLYSTSSTAQTRLKALLDLHILTYHPNDAAGYGIVDTRPAARAIV